MGDSFFDEEEAHGEGSRACGPFDPATELDINAARLRNQNKSDIDMENDGHPEFNSNLPFFNESDKSSMAELKEFNKLLIDRMYTAYNEHADELLKQGNINDIANKGEGLNKLELNREESLKLAKKNYNIAAEVFGIMEESDEEDKNEGQKLIKKKRLPQSQIADTYYRDIANIKAKRDLIKKNKKKRNTSVEVKSQNDLSKYKKKGVYALDQLKPLAKQQVYLQSEHKSKPKPMTREIPRAQIEILAESPNIKDSIKESSEPVDPDHIKFQSAEKSVGESTRKARYLGFTSLQEQPNRYANGNKHADKTKTPERGITKMHYDALKTKMRTNDFGIFVFCYNLDGETTHSVPLSVNQSEKDLTDLKKYPQYSGGMLLSV